MKINRLAVLSIVAFAAIGMFVLHAAKPGDFSATQIAEIWTEIWKSADATSRAPKIEKLSEQQVIERLTGKWTVMFGVIPDKLTITVRTNRLVEVSGHKDGKDWKKTGEWRVVADKLVLFLEQDDIPSFIFRIGQRDYIFDPWAKTMKSELKREKRS
jgi:hypothetical protein